jgi:hypothetical protein
MKTMLQKSQQKSSPKEMELQQAHSDLTMVDYSRAAQLSDLLPLHGFQNN